MTEENNDLKFKAPSIPAGQPASEFVKPASATVTTVSPAEGSASAQVPPVIKTNYDNNFAADFNLPPKVLQTKFVFMFAGIILILGMLFGCVFAPSGAPTQQCGGLGDIVINPAYQNHPVRRCGQVDVNQACVLYIMNARPSDRYGRDFFEQASNITGVPVHTIRISNVEYSEKLIRPGFITQIYIPKR